MLALCAFAKVMHHVMLDIGGEYFAFRNALGDFHTEISGARADVSYARSTL